MFQDLVKKYQPNEIILQWMVQKTGGNKYIKNTKPPEKTQTHRFMMIRYLSI